MLGVIVPYFNPLHDPLRQRNTVEFLNYLSKFDGIYTILVESIQDNTQSDLTLFDHPHWLRTRFQWLRVRPKTVIWRKENLINIGFQYLRNCDNVVWLDSDIKFSAPDWPKLIERAFEKYAALQVFETALLMQQGAPFDIDSVSTEQICAVRVTGLAYEWCRGNNAPQKEHPFPGHTGLGWGMRSSVFKRLGGLPQWAIVGGGDTEIACGLHSHDALEQIRDWKSPVHFQSLYGWSIRARSIVENVGYAPCRVSHDWHGDEDKRQYYLRTQILIDAEYNPVVDTYVDSNGVLELSSTGMRLQTSILSYLQARI